MFIVIAFALFAILMVSWLMMPERAVTAVPVPAPMPELEPTMVAARA